MPRLPVQAPSGERPAVALDKGQCARCPSGADCSEAGTQLSTLRLRRGYWRWRLDLPEVRRCYGTLEGGRCRGGVGFDVWMGGNGEPDACLIKVPEWDFDWQLDYWYPRDQYVPFDADDLVGVRCSYDNSIANQPIVQGGPLRSL